jgi:hypothetical protein
LATTNFKFTLGPQLLLNLTGSTTGNTSGQNNGAYVFAFAFAGGILQSQTTLVSQGNYQSNQTSLPVTYTNADPFASGNIIVVTQQTGPAGTSNLGTKGTITTIGQVLDVTAATTNHFRYDAIEFTLSGAGTSAGADVADLTDITQFGAPMSISVNYSNPTLQPKASVGFNVSGAALVNALTALSPAPGGQNVQGPYVFPAPYNTPLNEQREIYPVANNLSPNPLNVATDWQAYVSAFARLTNSANNIRIATFFNGNDKVTPVLPPILSYYDVTHDDFNKGTFWLVPHVIGGGVTQSTAIIGIPDGVVAATMGPNALTSNIYAQTGGLTTYKSVDGAVDKTYTSFTPNDDVGNVSKMFVAGFDAGFWGGSAKPLNPQITGSTLGLSQTWNWNAAYAYGATLTSNNYGYTNSFGTGTGTVGSPTRQMFYDPISGYFFKNTNAYGYSYSDLISNGGGVNPGISIFDQGTNADVTSVDIGLFDLSDTPTGYTAPNLPYVAPSGATYSAATTPVGSNQFIFDVALRYKLNGQNIVYAPDAKNTAMAFRFYTGTSQVGAGADGFVTLSLPKTLVSGIYSNYTITNSNLSNPSLGTWSISPGGTNDFGTFIIQGAPRTADNSTGWYQLVLGSGNTGKTYNIYASQTATEVTKVQMDGGGGAVAALVAIVPSHATFALASGGNITYDPSYFASANPPPLPTPPGPTPASTTTIFSDINGDGFADIILQNEAGDVFAWEQNGLTTIGAGAISSPGSTWKVAGTGDINGDGKADIILQNLNGDVFAWEQNGLSTIGAGPISSPGAVWRVRGVGDINGDGYADIVLQNQNGDVYAWEMNGLNVIGAGLIAPSGPNWQVQGLGDINHDGRADIILQNHDGDVYGWEQNGLTTIGAGLIAPAGPTWQVEGLGDINGDGFADITLQNTNAGGDVFAWEMNGLNVIEAGLISSPGSVWGVGGTVDLNGDHKADVILQHQVSAGGDVFSWEQNGLTTIGAGAISSPGSTWKIGV